MRKILIGSLVFVLATAGFAETAPQVPQINKEIVADMNKPIPGATPKKEWTQEQKQLLGIGIMVIVFGGLTMAAYATCRQNTAHYGN